MSKKVFTILLVLLILITSLSVINAADTSDASNDTVDSNVEDTDIYTDSMTTDTDNSNKETYATDTSSDRTNKEIDTTTSSKSLAKKSVDTVKGSPQLDINLSTSNITIDYGDTIEMAVVTNPTVNEGVLTWFIDDMFVGVKNLSRSPPVLELETGNYEPGNYTILVSYTSSLNYANNQTTATLTINKITTQFTSITSDIDENGLELSFELTGRDGAILDFGTVDVYYNNEVIGSLEFDGEDYTITLDNKYNNKLLHFEYTGDVLYGDTSTTQLISEYKNTRTSVNQTNVS